MEQGLEPSAEPLVSVVINNHNYARYLPAAITSAQAQTYTPVELIVVDDGSTDASRALLAELDNSVRVILQENGGQAAAMNTGFAASRGELVIFLDSDDRLHPDCVAQVVAHLTPDAAKVQYRLTMIDADANPTGVDPPWSVAMPSGDLTDGLLLTGRTVCPVTSGNAYPRRTLERLMPIPADDFRISADGYLNTLAPFLGPVLSIDDDLGDYRQHAANRWAFTAGITTQRLHAKLEHDETVRAYLGKAAAEAHRELNDDYLDADLANLRHRLCSLRLDPRSHPFPRDDVRTLVRRGVAAAFADRRESLPDRVYAAAGFLALGIAPDAAVPTVVAFLLASRPKPAWLRTGARIARRLTGRGGEQPDARPRHDGSR